MSERDKELQSWLQQQQLFRVSISNYIFSSAARDPGNAYAQPHLACLSAFQAADASLQSALFSQLQALDLLPSCRNTLFAACRGDTGGSLQSSFRQQQLATINSLLGLNHELGCLTVTATLSSVPTCWNSQVQAVLEPLATCMLHHMGSPPSPWLQAAAAQLLHKSATCLMLSSDAGGQQLQALASLASTFKGGLPKDLLQPAMLDLLCVAAGQGASAKTAQQILATLEGALGPLRVTAGFQPHPLSLCLIPPGPGGYAVLACLSQPPGAATEQAAWSLLAVDTGWPEAAATCVALCHVLREAQAIAQLLQPQSQEHLAVLRTNISRNAAMMLEEVVSWLPLLRRSPPARQGFAGSLAVPEHCWDAVLCSLLVSSCQLGSTPWDGVEPSGGAAAKKLGGSCPRLLDTLLGNHTSVRDVLHPVERLMLQMAMHRLSVLSITPEASDPAPSATTSNTSTTPTATSTVGSTADPTATATACSLWRRAMHVAQHSTLSAAVIMLADVAFPYLPTSAPSAGARSCRDMSDDGGDVQPKPGGEGWLDDGQWMAAMQHDARWWPLLAAERPHALRRTRQFVMSAMAQHSMHGTHSSSNPEVQFLAAVMKTAMQLDRNWQAAAVGCGHTLPSQVLLQLATNCSPAAFGFLFDRHQGRLLLAHLLDSCSQQLSHDLAVLSVPRQRLAQLQGLLQLAGGRLQPAGGEDPAASCLLGAHAELEALMLSAGGATQRASDQAVQGPSAAALTLWLAGRSAGSVGCLTQAAPAQELPDPDAHGAEVLRVLGWGALEGMAVEAPGAEELVGWWLRCTLAVLGSRPAAAEQPSALGPAVDAWVGLLVKARDAQTAAEVVEEQLGLVLAGARQLHPAQRQFLALCRSAAAQASTCGGVMLSWRADVIAELATHSDDFVLRVLTEHAAGEQGGSLDDVDMVPETDDCDVIPETPPDAPPDDPAAAGEANAFVLRQSPAARAACTANPKAVAQYFAAAVTAQCHAEQQQPYSMAAALRVLASAFVNLRGETQLQVLQSQLEAVLPDTVAGHCAALLLGHGEDERLRRCRRQAVMALAALPSPRAAQLLLRLPGQNIAGDSGAVVPRGCLASDEQPMVVITAAAACRTTYDTCQRLPFGRVLLALAPHLLDVTHCCPCSAAHGPASVEASEDGGADREQLLTDFVVRQLSSNDSDGCLTPEALQVLSWHMCPHVQSHLLDRLQQLYAASSPVPLDRQQSARALHQQLQGFNVGLWLRNGGVGSTARPVEWDSLQVAAVGDCVAAALADSTTAAAASVFASSNLHHIPFTLVLCGCLAAALPLGLQPPQQDVLTAAAGQLAACGTTDCLLALANVMQKAAEAGTRCCRDVIAAHIAPGHHSLDRSRAAEQSLETARQLAVLVDELCGVAADVANGCPSVTAMLLEMLALAAAAVLPDMDNDWQECLRGLVHSTLSAAASLALHCPEGAQDFVARVLPKASQLHMEMAVEECSIVLQHIAQRWGVALLRDALSAPGAATSPQQAMKPAPAQAIAAGTSALAEEEGWQLLLQALPLSVTVLHGAATA